MSSFEQRKQEIFKGEKSKVFSISDFNKLGTALLNDPSYTTTVVSTKDGELVKKEITPVADLRQKLIGGIMKDAGHDAAEQKKMIEEHQFSNLPLYGYVSELITQNMESRPFTFLKKEDMQATIRIESQGEEVKEVKIPKTGEAKKRKYSSYRKVKVKSTCPDNLKQDI